MNRISTIFAALLTFCIPVAPAEEPTYGVCEVLAKRTSLNNSILNIRGIQLSTPEGVWLEDNCKGLDLGDFPAIIWLDMSAERRKKSGVDGVNLDASIELIDKGLEKDDFQPARGERLRVTYVGLFKTFEDDIKKHSQREDKDRLRLFGFGHLGGAPAELIVKNVFPDVAIEKRHRK